MSNPNEYVETYLKGYFERKDPGFAVMVTAPWGAGKTHLIKSLIECYDDGEKPLYISLFGATSHEDIEMAILQAIAPYGKTKLGKILGKIGRTAVSKTGLTLRDLNVIELLGDNAPRALVFDDLERTEMKVSELLGYLNGFVEHGGKNVVLIANEEIFWGANDRINKEKVIGQTLTLRADVDAAIDKIIDALSDEKTKQYLKENKDTIALVFGQSKTENLRVLGQCMWDFQRLHLELEQVHKENVSGMRELLTVFVALSIEFKSGGLERIDFENRDAFILDSNKNPEHQKLIDVSNKYYSMGMKDGRYQTPLKTETAIALICDGLVDAEQINDSLLQTPYFQQQMDETEWETVFLASEREEDEVALAVSMMEEKFKNREYHDPGVALHVFSNRLRMIDMGYLDMTLEKVEEECVQYIEDISNSGILHAFDPSVDWQDGYGYTDTGHKGYGWPTVEGDISKTFRRLFECMREEQKLIFEKGFPIICKELLEYMETDVDRFALLLSAHNSKESHYILQPVLKAMDAGEFVDKLLSLKVGNQKRVFDTLKERFGFVRPELEPEHAWFRSLYAELQERVTCLSPFLQYRVNRQIEYIIKPIVNQMNNNDEMKN